MRHLSLVAVVALSCVVSAQGHVSSPPGFDSQLGTNYTALFGSGSFARCMMLDGEFRNRAMILKGVSYRPKAISVTEGRTWSSVTLRVSECVFDNAKTKTTVAFASVPTTTPTVVFQGSSTWPGDTSTTPPAWSVQFPFTSSWLYSGKQDICLDYEFNGGVLKGATGPWWKGYPVSYFLDGYTFASIVVGTSKNYGQGCQDSRQVRRSSMSLQAYSYSPDYTNHPQFANHSAFGAQTETGPNASVVYALSLGGTSAGVTIPQVTCEKLYVDLTKPTLFVAATASASGWSQAFAPPAVLIPYDLRFVNVPFWIQVAWNDTQTGQMSLTPAVTAILPELPPYYLRKAIYSTDNADPFGSVRPENYYNPIARFTK